MAYGGASGPSLAVSDSRDRCQRLRLIITMSSAVDVIMTTVGTYGCKFVLIKSTRDVLLTPYNLVGTSKRVAINKIRKHPWVELRLCFHVADDEILK